MKKNCLAIVSIIAFCFLASTSSLWAQAGTQGAIEAKEISKEEAAKKYPAGKKGYMEALPTYALSATSNGGFFKSPYSNKMYDCRKVKAGSLVLDTYAKPPQVFVVPAH
jgi:hypothetical protein